MNPQLHTVIFRNLLHATATLSVLAGAIWLTLPNLDEPVIPSAKPKPDQSLNNKSLPVAVSFRDDTFTRGINHSHLQQSDYVMDLVDTIGAGVCSGDINNDGLPDLVFASGGGATRHYGRQSFWTHNESVSLYLNRGSHFENITPSSTIALSASTMGCALADFDNDGLSDLLLTANGPLQLYRNLDGLHFSAVSSFSALNGNRWSTSAAVADINGDGLLDIYITNYLRYEKGKKFFELTSGFTEQQKFQFNPSAYDGEYNLLLRNDGNMQFSDISEISGMRGNADRSLSALWLDQNQDHRLDLLVLNDGGTPSRLFLQQEGLQFKESSETILPYRIDSARHALLLPTPQQSQPALVISRAPGEGNLFLQMGVTAATQRDHGWEMGLNNLDVIHLQRWGMAAADFNGDSASDLFQTAGIARSDTYTNTLSSPQRNALFVAADGGFTSVRLTTDRLRAPESSRSAVALDYDLDGRPDLAIANNNDFPQLLHNDSAKAENWIGLWLPQSGRWANARVRVNQGGQVIDRINRIVAGHLGTQDGPHLLVLNSTTPVQVTLTDQHDQSVTLRDVQPNQHYRLDADHALVAIAQPAQPANPVMDLVAADPERNLPLYLQYLANSVEEPERQATLTRLREQVNRRDLTGLYRQNLLQQPMLPAFEADYLAALQAPETRQRLAAIAALRALESEASVNFLLPLLADDVAEVQCAVANTFAHWYHEEEAVTKGKWRAVPYLIRALESAAAPDIPCIAHALGESEHLTATMPLQQRFQREAGVANQIALIRAIGKVRQTTVLPFLHQVLATTDQGKVAAEALVALQRLNAPDVQTLALATVHNDSLPLHTRIDLVGHLLLSPEGTVIEPALLRSMVESLQPLLQPKGAPMPVNAGADPDHYLAVLAQTNSVQDTDLLQQAISSNKDQVRALALVNLDKLGKVDSTTLTRLFQRPVSGPVWQALATRKPNLRDDEIVAITASDAGRTHLFSLLDRLDSETRRKAVASLEAFAGRDRIALNDDIWQQLCHSGGIEFQADAIQHSAFAPEDAARLLALATPGQVAKGEPALANAWWAKLVSLTPATAIHYFECLNTLTIPAQQRERIDFSLLTNPQLPASFKTIWAITQPDSNHQAAQILQNQAATAELAFIEQIVGNGKLPLLSTPALEGWLQRSGLDQYLRLALVLELAQRRQSSPNLLISAVAP